MKIKTRLNLISHISLGVILFMVPFLSWSFHQSCEADQNVSLIADIDKIAFERTLLRDEFLMNGEYRSRMQWESKAEELRRLQDPARNRFIRSEDGALLKEIERNSETTVVIFNAILRSREKDTDQKKIYLAETKSRLQDQILAQDYSLRDAVALLHNTTHKKAASAHRRSTYFLIAFVVLTSIAGSQWVNRTFAKRMTMLKKGEDHRRRKLELSD